MIQYIRGNLFTSNAKVLVNTVNTVGVMGKGIAYDFKKYYPKMFEEYKQLCDKNQYLCHFCDQFFKARDLGVLNFRFFSLNP